MIISGKELQRMITESVKKVLSELNDEQEQQPAPKTNRCKGRDFANSDFFKHMQAALDDAERYRQQKKQQQQEKPMTEAAMRPTTREKIQQAIDSINSQITQIQSEYGEGLVDLSDGDVTMVNIDKLPKLYKNGMMVLSINGEVIKCTFDKSKLDMFSELEDGRKILKYLNRLVQWTMRDYQEYDPAWDDTPNAKKFASALRANKPFTPKP